MNKKEDLPFFLSRNDGLGQVRPEDDLLHPEQNKAVSDDSLTETQYFGFSIPEQCIHAIGYTWYHPNLHVVSGGLMVFQGIKRHTISAELSDVRIFMHDRSLKNDLHDYRLANGYGIKVIEPLKQYRMTYADAARQNAVDIHFEALQPPVMFADGMHLEQCLHAKGEISLRGKRYDVDCFNIRDRSWGRPRQEDSMPLPPLSWNTGMFSKDFAFNCNILDQPEGNPEIKGIYELPMEKTVNGGWIRRDGKVGFVVGGSKRVVRNPDTLFPESIDFSITDDLGRTIDVRGTILAACPWPVWPNIWFPVCLARWECDGEIGYGDCQEGMWSDYANHVLTNAA